MSSLADCPNEEMPWWAVDVWYRCRICKVCFQFQDDLLKHKLKHLTTSDSESDDEDQGQIGEEPTILQSESIDDDEASVISVGSSSPDDDVVALEETAISPLPPIVNIDSPSESLPEPESENSGLAELSEDDHQTEIICSIEVENEVDEEESDESSIDESKDKTIILNRPSVIVSCEKSQNCEEGIETDNHAKRHIDRKSKARKSSLKRSKRRSQSPTKHSPRRPLYTCPFCKKKFTTSLFRERHVGNCKRPFGYRKRSHLKRASKQNDLLAPTLSFDPMSSPTKPLSTINLRRRSSKTPVLRKQPKRKASSDYIQKSVALANLVIKNSNELKAKKPTRKVSNKCHICQKILPGQQSLQVHIKQHLIKDKPFLCNICKLRFVTKPGLTNHLITKHSRFRNYELSNC